MVNEIFDNYLFHKSYYKQYNGSVSAIYTNENVWFKKN